MRHPEKVTTTLGSLSGVEAFALIQMLEHDGIVALRRLMQNRVLQALTNLRNPRIPGDPAMFERGALDAMQGLDTILVDIRKEYDDASDKESITDGTQDARRDADTGRRDDPGPG